VVGTLEWVPQRLPWDHLVVVAPADPVDPHVARRRQVGDDLLGGPLRDADEVGNVAQADLRVAPYAQENVGVVRQERP
jgi:hypothetical protein